jgi:NADPH2:quinone reductase
MFSLFTPATVAAANTALLNMLADKAIEPVVARTFPLAEAAEAQRNLIEDRPFGRVLLTLAR